MIEVHYIVKSLEDTESVAQKVAHSMTLPAVIALTGDLGTGKTTFAQLLAKNLGVTDFLPSPTFTLVNEYATQKISFIHADLYRLENLEEAQHLGLQDYFSQPNTLIIIEWADRYPELIPNEALWITFMQVDSSHRIMDIATQNEGFWHRFKEQAL